MTLRQKYRRLRLAKRAYKIICFKTDVEDARFIEAEYKDSLLKTYIEWVYALAKALQKTTSPDLRKALIIGSIEEIHGTLKTLGRKYLTKSFDVATGRKSLRKKQWEPDEEALDEMLDEAIDENDHYLAMSLVPALYGTAESLFEEPETQTSIRETLLARAYQVGQYASAVWPLFWGGYVESRHPDTYYVWKGTDDEALCPGCEPRLDQIYNKATIPGIPADGSTPCEMGCRCWLEQLADVPFPFDLEGEEGEFVDLEIGYEQLPDKDREYLQTVKIQRGLKDSEGIARKGFYRHSTPGTVWLDTQASTKTFVHECGHLVYFERLRPGQRQQIYRIYKEYMGAYQGLGKSARERLAKRTGQISGYAWTNEAEFFADSYAYYFRGQQGTRLRGVPEIWQWFDGEY